MQATTTTLFLRLVFFLLVISFSSCRTYNQNIMFKTTGSLNQEKLKQSLVNVEQNYIIQPNDYLDVRVYTNKGERIFDPNGELPFGAPGGGQGGAGGGTTSRRTTTSASRGGVGVQGNQSSDTEFLVQFDGTVHLPMVNDVKLNGLTLLQADSLLQKLYSTYYVDPFVRTRVSNNRVFVLGAIGGQGSGGGGGAGGQGGIGGVIFMQNDNMNLLEVLAQVGGINPNAKAHNVKIIRNYMTTEPIVQIVDLSTIEGMRKASLYVEPNDVIYIEPNQRIFFEVLKDVGPVISTFVSVISTYFIITNLGARD